MKNKELTIETINKYHCAEDNSKQSLTLLIIGSVIFSYLVILGVIGWFVNFIFNLIF